MSGIASRTVSNSSRTTFTGVNLKQYCPELNVDDVYLYTLKLLILEYINQPKFQQKAALSSSYTKTNPNTITKTPAANNTNEIEDMKTVLLLRDRLAKYLYDVTLCKRKVSDPMFKRCLLKFNNDTFMNTAMDKTLQNLKNSEELIVWFTKAANNELNKLNIDNIQSKLYELIGKFLKLLIKLLPSNTSNTYINKLKAYNISDVSTRRKNRRSISLNQSSNGKIKLQSAPHQNNDARSFSSPSTDCSKNLTFKLEEIPYSDYFCKLFSKDKIIVQQHIIKLINVATNFSISRDLSMVKEQIMNDDSFFRKEDFEANEDYILWKDYQLKEITKLLKKFTTIGRAPISFESLNVIIPRDPRFVFTSLLCFIFQLEFIDNRSSFTLSQPAHFFLSKASKYWNVGFPSTLSTTVYTAVNLTVLNDAELKVGFTENLFSMIMAKFLQIDNHIIDTFNWNMVDKRQWEDNILFTARQCLVSIDNLLSALFAITKPKFSPVLSFYYTFIQNGFNSEFYLKSLEEEFSSRFKNTIFKCSEDFYKSLLTSLPKDDSFAISDVQNVAELITKEIQMIQKRYTNPLLEKVNIALECARMLTKAVAIDGPHMFKRLEEIEKQKGQSLSPINALSIYSDFKELRNIYEQVQKNDDIFPFKLERTFSKYLTKFAKDIANRVKGAFESSIKNETWTKIDNDHLYSSSVLDIFKLINESLSLFDHFEWDIDYRYAEAINIVLESFSEGIQYYCDHTYKLLRRSLRSSEADSYETSEPELETSSRSENRKSRWNFEELKKVINTVTVIEFPRPYKYNLDTCVILNNIDKMESLLLDLESRLSTVELSSIMIKHQQKKLRKNPNMKDRTFSHIYSIRIKDAHDIKGNGSDGLSNSFVCVSYVDQHFDIAETKVVPKSNDPVWDEVFDLTLKANTSSIIMFRVWHKPIGRFKSLKNKIICGKGFLTLNEKEFTNDGYPNPKIISLDTQGELNIEVSLEMENSNPLSNISKSCRKLSRTRDRITQAIVSKFTPFINIAFSKDVLKNVCDNNSPKSLNDDIIYDAIVPLFDYLNANLDVLAKELSTDLLFAVMLEVWNDILQTADNLLLPQLEVAKHRLAQTRKSIWNVGSSLDINGYGKPLTVSEVEIVFKWLDALCVDFFYNQGEGPSLESLKNEAYQDLLLIPIYYDKSTSSLKKEVQKLTPLYYKHMADIGSDVNAKVSRKMTTVERRMTKMTEHKKKNVKDSLGEKYSEINESRNTERSSISRSLVSLDIILRILITKNEMDYVYEHLHERKMKLKRINIKSMAKRVAQGHKIKYRN